MIIRPEIFTTPDCPIVKFREVTANLDVEIPRILQTQGWGLGTIFCVQFMNHEKTELIKMARFVVSFEDSSIQTFNPDSQSPMTKLVEARRAKQMEDWFYPNGFPTKGMEVKWNPGAKKHEVRNSDNEVLASFDKKPDAEDYIEKAA